VRTIRGDEAPADVGPPERFVGRVVLHTISETLGANGTHVRHVRFDPGARSRPHVHFFDQLLLFLEPGIVAVDGGPDRRTAAGEYVLIPAEVIHMHGATPDAPSSHVSIQTGLESDFACALPAAWEHWRGISKGCSARTGGAGCR
jgi:quercetin dioxygenase-like cupin family protein